VELSSVGLRIAQEVAVRGSFAAAAEALGYTQSAVSRRMQALEAMAGVPLFERQAREVRPTAAGAILLRHAHAVLDRVAAAELELAGLQDRLEGWWSGRSPPRWSRSCRAPSPPCRDEHPAGGSLVAEGLRVDARRVRRPVDVPIRHGPPARAGAGADRQPKLAPPTGR